jgi:hypothetical protein
MSNGDDRPQIVANDNVRAAKIVGIVLVVGLVLLAAATYVSNYFEAAARLPFLVIAGLMALVGMLAAMAIAFKTVRLANQTQALGLPDGSIRAVIALSLILIFAVVTVYLFSELSNPMGVEEIKAAIEKCCPANRQPPSTSTVTDSAPPAPAPAPPAPAAPSPVDQATAAANNAASAVTKLIADRVAADKAAAEKAANDQRMSSAGAAQDFAKQLLIMLGTLITSITSFYFGSKTATDAPGRPAPTPPKPSSVDPNSIPAVELPKTVTVKGTGMQLADTVTLRNAAGDQIGTDPPLSSETTVQFTVPKGVSPGKWDVVVRTRDGGEAAMPGAMTIT